MAKICPCSKNLTKEDYSFYILIIDALLSVGNGLGMLIPLIGVFIYLKDRNYHHWFFFYYSWLRVILPFFLIAVFIITLLMYLNIISNDIRKKDNDFFKSENFIGFSIFIILWTSWLLYTGL